jgi:hypothetical protein
MNISIHDCPDCKCKAIGYRDPARMPEPKKNHRALRKSLYRLLDRWEYVVVGVMMIALLVHSIEFREWIGILVSAVMIITALCFLVKDIKRDPWWHI